MYIVEYYFTAVILSLITMVCWGSWANTQKVASKEWPFQLFYWDYAIGVFLFSLIFAFTLGSFGQEGRPFVQDLLQADLNPILLALLGGIIFNLSNILLVAAVDIAGLAVAFPIAIGFSCSIGVVVNYIAVPVGNPVFLFIGIALLILAVVMDALAYKRLSTSRNTNIGKGLLISVLSGVLMGFFYRFVAASVVNDFAVPEAGKLTPYTAVVIFSLGVLLSNFIWNTNLFAKLSLWKPVNYGDYFTKGSVRLHTIGLIGGIIWSIGMGFSIIASGKAGYAITFGLGQGGTMVAAFWGVFIWKEFKGAPRGTNRILAAMFALYIIAILLIIYSRNA
ncbi:MAG: multidrug DMT transporter permease [Bacteroidales bacterium]|nr:multidrug DMT transporter permease [Bacteroidales bacterium]MBN2699090.1 multidrug DMT transporter permease [Bacteroidales bacterium]